MTARFVSHAQNWEDVRLRRIFGDRASGLYVDVGAAHPTFHSFSHVLYTQGWRGINVEPIPAFFSLIEDERPEDVNLRAVLGREPGGSVTFFEAPEQRGSSTTRADVAEDLRAQGFEVVEYEVPVLTLAGVCDEHVGDRTIDVLKVDVEGAEAEVLGGGDWQRFRPRLVVVEVNKPEAWEHLLLENGYRFAAFDGVNNWYVEQSETGWTEVLAPPVSTLDHFVPLEIVHEVRSSTTVAVAPPVAPRVPGRERPRMLLVISSSNQLYSGTGRVLFETIGRLLDDLDVELAIDDEDARNVALARGFCEEHGLALHVGRAMRVPGAPDAGNAELQDVLRSQPWDLVMAISWANAATNGALLEGIGGTALAYLPQYQPTWTVPLDEGGRELVEQTLRAMVARADVNLCISPYEQQVLTELVPEVPHTAVVPHGCDFTLFRPGPGQRRPDLLYVGDHREPRKRFDRVVGVFERVRARGIDARLVVVGNHSEEVVSTVAPELAGFVVSVGYVDEDVLRRTYRESAVLLLLSEYEAFGLPVLESLASATPVVMSEQPAPRSLFGDEAGVHFVAGDDVDAAADVTARLLLEGAPVRHALAERHEALASRLDWPVIARRIRNQLLAAWARGARRSAGFVASRAARP